MYSQGRRRLAGGTPQRGLIGATLLCVALLCAGGISFADPVDDLLSVGKKAFGDAQYSLAAKSFQYIVDQFPESVKADEATYLFGVSLYYAGSWDDSLSTFATLQTRYPRSSLVSRAPYWMGAADIKLQRFTAALDSLATARSTGAESYRLQATMLSGIAAEALGKDADAGAWYRSILSDPRAGALIPEATFRLAGTEFRAGRYASARDLYSKVLLSFPQSSFVRDSVFFLAESELSLGDFAEAEKRYRTILSLYPDSAYREAASFRLADVAWRQKKGSAAVDMIDAFQKQFPAGAYRGSAVRLKGDIYLDQKRYDQAIVEYNRALGMLRDSSEIQAAHYGIGMAQLGLGRKQEATSEFAAAGVGADKTMAEKAAFEGALLLAGAGKNAEAIVGLDGYLRVFPAGANAEEATRLLASLLEDRGDMRSAAARWDSLVTTYPQSTSLAEYLYRRGNAYLAVGSGPSALDDFQRVYRDYPTSSWRNESAYAIGYLYTQRGEYPRALPFFQALTRGAGEVADRGSLSLGVCLFNMGNFDAALSTLQALRARKPTTVPEGTIVLYMGRTLYRMEKLADAAARLTEASTLLAGAHSQDGADAQYWLGWADLRLGNLVDSRDAFLALATRYPNDPRRAESLFRAGVCETQRHDDAAALRLFETVIAIPRAADSAAGGSEDMREQALYEKGWALLRTGRSTDAIADFEVLAHDYPDGTLAPQALFKLAENSLDASRYTEARDGFSRVARDFPRSELAAQALYWSGEASRHTGDAPRALAAYWSCLVAHPQAGLLASTLDAFTAVIHEKNDLSVAKDYADKAASTPGLAGEATAGVRLAYVDLLLDAHSADALALIMAIGRSAPPEPWAGEVSLALGRYYTAQGQGDKALDILSTLESSRVDEVGARAGLEKGRTLEALGRTADAVEEFVKVSYLFPDFSDLAAEGLFNGARLARARGDAKNAARIEQSLKTTYPASAWTARLGK